MAQDTNRNGNDMSLQPSIVETVTAGSDTTFDQPRTLFIGTTGDLDVTLWGTDGTNGGRGVYKNLANGSDFPRLVKTIHDATTSASDILSEY